MVGARSLCLQIAFEQVKLLNQGAAMLHSCSAGRRTMKKSVTLHLRKQKAMGTNSICIRNNASCEAACTPTVQFQKTKEAGYFTSQKRKTGKKKKRNEDVSIAKKKNL